jgi:phosphatidylserine/phosphatidylglycerophosphate/cardiolipin synthase-like enzyme
MAKHTSRRGRTGISLASIIIVVALLVIAYYLYRQSEAEIPGGLLGPTTPPAATAAPTTAGAIEEESTPGAASAWYQVYFTTPKYPDKPEYHHGGIDERLVAFINSAKQTVDVADYDFDLQNVATALAQAAARGVRVRMVTDTDTLTNDDAKIQKAFDILKKAKIPIVDDQRPAIMHDKFVVVDGRAIWTGSWNFTEGDTYRLNNNAIQIASPELAQNYTTEFEQMFTERKFGPSKLASTPHMTLKIGGVRVENYFAPRDHVADRVVARLRQAKTSIHFMAFSFTSKPIGTAVLERAKAGVEVQGVFETTGSETSSSQYPPMKRAKLDVLQDGNPYVMHHKVFIIDGKTVIFGSFNFSNNADKDNDENLLIVDDPALAQAFEAEFQRVRDQALNPPKKK